MIIVNFVAEIGLIRGRQTRAKIINGLLKMYKDQVWMDTMIPQC